MTILIAFIALVPIALYFWREHKMSTPSLQWPILSKILGLQYEANPARMSGTYNGRKVAVESAGSGAALTVWLAAKTRLRVECGLKDVVVKRAGIVVQDPVEPIDRDFRDRLLARCSDKAAGPVVFDEAMQQRLVQLKEVDFVGEDTRVTWRLSELKDPDAAEAVLGALCGVADALDSFPAAQGMPRA